MKLLSDFLYSRRFSSNEDIQFEYSFIFYYSRKFSTDYEFLSLDVMENDIFQKSSLIDLSENDLLEVKLEENLIIM